MENLDAAGSSDALLSEKILDFLSSPWLYASSEELAKATGGNSLEFFRSSPGAWRHFTHQAYQLWNLGPCWHDFPKNDNSRIMLLNKEDTDRLILLLGLLAFFPKLKTVISGAQTRELKKNFPGLYPGCLRLTGIHPAVLEKLTAADNGSSSETDKKSISTAGRSLLEGMLCHLPEELLRRWHLKFTATGQGKPAQPLLTLEESNGLLLSLLHHLHPESWQLCCC